MDRKKKNGANVSGDHDGKSDRDSRPVPTHTVSGDRDRARASTSASSDKDSNKAHSHAPDDANKQGPQKKRRKVTHGTALSSSVLLAVCCPAPLPFFLPGHVLYCAR